MRLAPGRVLVRPVETQETLAGGRILLTEATREHWTMGQAEVIAVGPPQVCEDEGCERIHDAFCQTCGVWFKCPPLDPKLHASHYSHTFAAERHHLVDERLHAGSWVLCKPRTFVEVPEGYIVLMDNIVGVFTAPSGQTPT